MLHWEEDAGDAVSTTIEKNREDVLNALLADSRTSVTMKDCEHKHALHFVEYRISRSASVVQKLVSKGADPIESDCKRQNSLHFASQTGDLNSAVSLLSLGFEPTLTDNEGLNALHYAAQSTDHETSTILLYTILEKRPSLIASKDNLGRNALHQLISTRVTVQIEAIRFLLDKGVNGLALDISSTSPLASYLKRYMVQIDFTSAV